MAGICCGTTLLPVAAVKHKKRPLVVSALISNSMGDVLAEAEKSSSPARNLQSDTYTAVHFRSSSIS